MRTLLVTLLLALLPLGTAAAVDLSPARCDAATTADCARIACSAPDADGIRLCTATLEVPAFGTPFQVTFGEAEGDIIEDVGVPLVGLPCIEATGVSDREALCTVAPEVDAAGHRCTRASVLVEAAGRGSVTGTARCGNDPYASCGVGVNGGSGACRASDSGNGASWWSCSAYIRGSVGWSVTCTFS